MAATPQERLALGVAALLLAAGAAARVLTAGPPPAELSGAPGVEKSASALAKDVEASVEKEERRSTPLAPGEIIDVNTASAEELAALPDVGPATARKIVQHRRVNGRFASIDELDEVDGIGAVKLERLRAHVRVTP